MLALAYKISYFRRFTGDMEFFFIKQYIAIGKRGFFTANKGQKRTLV